jgi:hypothetical protein
MVMKPSTRIKASMILAEAASVAAPGRSADEGICKKYGISLRCLRRWRATMATDSELTEMVRVKVEPSVKAFAAQLAEAKQKALKAVIESIEAVPAKSPKGLTAKAVALKLIHEIELSDRVLNEWLNSEAKSSAVPAIEGGSPQYFLQGEILEGEAVDAADPDPVPQVESTPEESVGSG